MSAVLDHPTGHAHDHDDHHDHHAPTGWRRWVFATNHKDIGTMYLLFSFTMLMIGGILALCIRAELFQPGLQFFNPELFNQFTTMHPSSGSRKSRSPCPGPFAWKAARTASSRRRLRLPERRTT